MITLRELRDTDADALASQLNNKNVVRYLSAKIPFPYSQDDAKWFIQVGSKSGINRAIEYDGTLVGVVGVEPGKLEYERSGEIGYWFGESYWGLGIATKAVSRLTSHVFDSTDIYRLAAPVFNANKASMRVLEKCGYELESIQKKALFKDGEFYDAHVFVKLNS